MKTKLVKESLYESINTDGFSEGNSLGEQKCMQIIKTYLPFLSDVHFDDLGERGTPENPAYGDDEQYAKWDQLSIITGDEAIDDQGLSLYLVQDFDNDKIYAKFYFDAVNYNGYGQLNDEYTDEMDPIAAEDWDIKRYKSVLIDIKKNH